MSGTTPPRTGPAAWRHVLFNIFFASFGYVALRVLIAPVRIKLLTSLLSKEDYGLLTLVMLTVSFITLITSLGSLEYMLRKIPGRSESFQFTTLRTIMTYFGLLAGGVALLGGLALVAWRPEHLGLSTTDIIAGGLLLVLTVHLTQIVYFLMGRSAYGPSRLLMLLYADAWFLPVLLLMWSMSFTVSFMLWLWVVWLAGSALFAQIFVKTRTLLRHPVSRERLHEILVFGLPLLPMILGEWIFQVQDRYVLVALTNLEALAHFTLCFNIAWVGVSTGTSMLDVLITEFYKARNRHAETSLLQLAAKPDLQKALSMLLRYGLVLALPIVMALWLGREPIILLLSDPKFAEAVDLMPWVAPLPLLYLMVVINGRMLMAVDRGKIVGAATLVAAAVQLALSLTLTPHLAERGVALAGCCAYGLLAGYLGYRVKLWRWIDRHELKPLRLMLFTALTGATFYTIFSNLPGQHLLSLVAGGAATLVFMMMLGLVNRADLRYLMGSMHAPTEPEDAALQEPFARD